MFLQCVCRTVRQQLVSCLRRVQLQGHLGDHQGVHQEGSSSSCDARSWMEYSSWENCSSCGNWIASTLRMLQMAKEEAAWGNETHLGQHWGLLQGHYLLYLASLGWIQGPGTLWRSHFECELSTSSSTSSWSCEPWFNLGNKRRTRKSQTHLRVLNRGSEASKL